MAGDSGNDRAMFELESVNGILVANASDELSKISHNDRIFRASQPRHAGVVEGLVFYDLMPDEALEITLSAFEQR